MAMAAEGAMAMAAEGAMAMATVRRHPAAACLGGDVAQVSVGQDVMSGAVEALMTSIGGASRQEGAGGGGGGWLPRLDDAVKRELREVLSEVIRAVW
eukprot:COSAG01_NODE_21157_length_915_cov_1.621324_2_plen_97_part_00